MSRTILYEPSARDKLIIEHYKSGLTFRIIAPMFGIKMQRVHQIICRWAPDLIRLPSYRMKPSPYRRRTAAP